MTESTSQLNSDHDVSWQGVLKSFGAEITNLSKSGQGRGRETTPSEELLRSEGKKAEKIREKIKAANPKKRRFLGISF